MHKIIIYSLFFVIVIVGVACGENLQARDFRHDPQMENAETAVLVDADTGDEWTVRKGDEVDGWTVVKITSEYVEVSRNEEEQGYVAVYTLYYNDGPAIMKPASNQ
ncbi:MAG: hypothetical protein AB1724_10795 [Thermodesulfobacteriota bacterium]